MAEKIDSTSDFGIQNQVEEREIKIGIKIPRFKAHWIDFGYLWKEFKNIKSKHQEPDQNSNTTYSSPINEKSIQTKKATKIENVKKFVKSNWLKASVISFLLFVSSTYDVVSDGLLSHSFLSGAYYTKRLESRPDSQFWTIKDEILVNKAELWDSVDAIDWNFSRGNPGFENIFILSCKYNKYSAYHPPTSYYNINYAPQLWKLDGNKLRNKDGLWMSDDAWNFKSQNNSNYFVIENISNTKVLAKAAIPYAPKNRPEPVILEDLKEYKTEQLLWRKGEPNDEGYFTLTQLRQPTTLGLTAISSNSLKLEYLYHDAKLKVYDNGHVTISGNSADQDHCNPANCSEKIFWKKTPVMGDENYFTLESYNTERVLTAKGIGQDSTSGIGLEINIQHNDLVGKCENTKVYENTNYDPANKSATIKSNTIYEYRCFETDKTWGILSLTFMCIPGLFFWMYMTFSLTKMDCWPEDSRLKYGYIGLLAVGMLPLIIAYPFLLILVKFTSIFHHGLQWKKLDQFMTLCEGQLEGYLQVILQTYIVCGRADRVPSLIQISGLSMSFHSFIFYPKFTLLLSLTKYLLLDGVC